MSAGCCTKRPAALLPARCSFCRVKVGEVIIEPALALTSWIAFKKMETQTMMMEVPPFMGMATAINLQMIGERAANTGDFVLLATEVNPVVKALTENGIAVTALHNHMLFESPRLFFLHFWGFDTPEKLARGLKATLDKTNSAKRPQ